VGWEFTATCDLASTADGCGGVSCGGLTVAAQGSVFITEAVSKRPDDVIVGGGLNNNSVLRPSLQAVHSHVQTGAWLTTLAAPRASTSPGTARR
jgi:hypothetical protein